MKGGIHDHNLTPSGGLSGNSGTGCARSAPASGVCCAAALMLPRSFHWLCAASDVLCGDQRMYAQRPVAARATAFTRDGPQAYPAGHAGLQRGDLRVREGRAIRYGAQVNTLPAPSRRAGPDLLAAAVCALTGPPALGSRCAHKGCCTRCDRWDARRQRSHTAPRSQLAKRVSSGSPPLPCSAKCLKTT